MLAAEILVANGLETLVVNGQETEGGIKSKAVFHEIAQGLAANQIYKGVNGKNTPLPLPLLEAQLPSGKETDIVYNSQVWEVKPFGSDAEPQLIQYTEEGNWERGNTYEPVRNFHVYGSLYTSVYFMDKGVVNYSLQLKQDNKTTTVNVDYVINYVNQEYAARSKRVGEAQAKLIAAAAGARVVQGARSLWGGLKSILV